MPRTNTALVAFNRGRMSALGLARVDIERTAMSAEIQENWMPRTLGSMMLRPGTGHLGSIKDDSPCKPLPFIFAQDDAAILEITDAALRVWVDDTLITRPTVTAVVTNGTFDTDVTGWTDQDESGATSAWATGGYLSLVGTSLVAAKREQEVTLVETGIVHGIRVVISRGFVTLRIGSTTGDDDYVPETILGVGTHSLAITPTTNMFIQLWGYSDAASLVDSVAIEGSGTMVVPAPWAAADLANIRYDQSGDVVYIACKDVTPYKIERRATESWSVVQYDPDDGPFNVINVSPTTITPSGLVGDITLTASSPFFKAGHDEALFKFTSAGQEETQVVTAQNQFSDPIKVTGIGTQRAFSIITTGTWTATMTLQYSVGSPGTWIDVATYTANQSQSYDDGLDNEIMYYRLGVKSGDFTSGTINITLSFPSGSITGVVRITSVVSSTVVNAAVLSDLGGTAATSDWYEGSWSALRGYPTSVALYQGRLWWAGKDNNWGSISDAFESFDDDFIGDAGPISRSIGSGPVDVINWLLPLDRLVIGSAGKEISARSTSFDEPLTPSNYNLKDISTQGSKAIAAIKVDKVGLFVQKGGSRVFELDFAPKSVDYGSIDVTTHVPEMGDPGIDVLGIQRQPDTRLHAIRSDGTVAVMIYDRAENITCWVDVITAASVNTAGLVEEYVSLPGTTEDAVYYVIKRVIDGVVVRFLEKWAKESECQGGTLNKQIDAFKVVAPIGTAVTGLEHLEGETVLAWGDGKDLGSYTVASGAITLTEVVGSAVVGLGYQARFKSMKMAYAARFGTAVGQMKTIEALGLILHNTHYQGVQYGHDFDNLDNLPLVEEGAVTAVDTVWESYDQPAFMLDGEWKADARLCLVANSPLPATVLGAVATVTTHER